MEQISLRSSDLARQERSGDEPVIMQDVVTEQERPDVRARSLDDEAPKVTEDDVQLRGKGRDRSVSRANEVTVRKEARLTSSSAQTPG